MGKYIKKFDTHSDYEDFIETEDFIRPNVSYCVDNKDVHYNSIQTLFALEIESGRFISFYFQGSKLYANTDEGSSALWVLDANGVVIDNVSCALNDRARILEQINEHYGTSFRGWSDNEIGLRIGDTVPNWNAYEKIELLDDKIKLKMSDNMWSFASIRNNTVYVAASDEHTFFVVNNNGDISQILSGVQYLIQRNWLPKLSEAGFNYEVSQEIVDYQIGQSLENWSRYISI